MPGFIDLHSHIAYNALPLWSEPAQATPFRHHDHWTGARTYREKIGWPSWVLAKAAPEALLAYVQTRALVGGTTAIQGWPAVNRPPLQIVRNIDSEKAGTSNRNLIYTAALTEKPLQLAERARRLGSGAGFIYHCAEGQPGSIVAREFVDVANAGCLAKTFIGIHCNAVAEADWIRWRSDDAGAVVWSPFSNLWLYGTTSDVLKIQRRGVAVCLGSDWGPSGTKNVLGELKVAKIASDELGFALSDRDLVSMVTSSAGDILARCWSRQIGRLTPGAFADITVVRQRSGDVWSQILRATERDIMLVVVDGRARYGDAAVMTTAGATISETLTVGGRRRRLALVDPDDTTRPWKWRDVIAALDEVRRNPAAALRRAEGRRRAFAGRHDADDAPLELALDMPFGGRLARAGPPSDPNRVVVPKVPSLTHDARFFADVRAQGFHGGVLNKLAAFYA
jgi:cytosine/adenosine deaminase-related metal-dependent hydrolase